MSLDRSQQQLLRAALGRRPRAELKRLFATIRAHDDHALLAAITPPKNKAKRAIDPLVRDVEQALKPLLAPAAEKADLLIEHLAKKLRRNLAFEAKGLADAVRRLRAAGLSDTQILGGARSLVAQLERLHGRETVV